MKQKFQSLTYKSGDLIESINKKLNSILISKPNELKINSKIAATTNKNIYDVLVTEKWLVYVEASNNMIKNDWSLFIENIDNSQRIEIDKGKLDITKLKMVTPTFMGPLIAASNGKVAWSTFETDSTGATKAVLKLYDIANKTYKVIDKLDINDGEFGKPSIDGEWLVYDKGKIDMEKLERSGTIILLNLKNNKKTVLDKGMNVIDASIKYPYVIWKSGDLSIKMLNLETRTQKNIVFSSNGLWNISINRKYVAWNSNENGLKLYSIDKNQIIDFKDTGVTNGGNLTDNILWWYVRGANNPTSEWIIVK